MIILENVKISFDQEADAFYMSFNPEFKGEIKTDTLDYGMYVDYDHDDNVIGIEILDASNLDTLGWNNILSIIIEK